jgi:hypothetical protein
MYTRASPSDYDDWEQLENPGWGSKDLIPLSNKVRDNSRLRSRLTLRFYQAETFEPNAHNHGTSGPIKISSGVQTNIAKQYLAVAAARDKERGSTEDANDLSASSINVYSVSPCTSRLPKLITITFLSPGRDTYLLRPAADPTPRTIMFTTKHTTRISKFCPIAE